MGTVVSADGTRIRFDAWGGDQPLIMVDGATAHQAVAPLAAEAVAHTIAYDGRIMGSTMSGAPLPADRWAAVAVPTLVLHGRDTAPWLVAAAQALADLLPTASLRPVEGANHDVAAGVLAPVRRELAHTSVR